MRVDHREVGEARKDLDFLNKAALEAEKLDITLGGEELAKDTEMLRRAGLELTRLGSLVRTGDNKGGFLNVKQFQETSKLTKSIGSNLGSWTAHTQKLRNELKQVSSDLKMLQRDSLSPGLSANARAMMLDDMAVLSGRRDELKKELAGRAKYDARAGHLGRRAQEYSEALGGFGQDPGHESSGGSMAAMALARRAMGIASLAFGGGAILSAARNAWSEWQKQADREAGLLLRGVRFERRISPWSYLQSESADMALGLRRTTGAADADTLDRLERFSRLSNIDPGTAIGIAGGYYSVTGADPAKQRLALDALLFMGKQAKDGRTEALLQVINANLQTAFHAQGGKALSDNQVSQVVAQTAAMYNANGTQGMNAGIYSTMQNALLPGGDSIDEILSWSIVGGLDKKGPLTAKDFVEIQRRRSRGLNDPTNRKAAMDFIRRFGGNDRSMQILLAQKVLKQQFGMPGSVETAEWFLDNYARLQTAKMPDRKDILGDIARQTGLYQDTPAFDVGQRYARDSFINVSGGRKADPFAEGVQAIRTKGKQALVQALGGAFVQESKYDALILAKARKYGINPLLLKSIVQEESSYNRFAVSSKNARGLGQLIPSTGKQYGLKTEDDFYDPEKNLDASAHYLADLQREFGGNVSSMVLGYHSGASNVRKGNLGPAANSYHKKVMRDFRSYSQNDNWNDWRPAAQGTEGVGLLERIASTLDEISRKLGNNTTPKLSDTDYAGMMGWNPLLAQPLPTRPR